MNNSNFSISDEEKSVQNIVKRNKNKQRIDNKIIFVACAFIFCLCFLILRVAYIKVVKGPEYEKIAVEQQTQRLSDTTTSPMRGKISDRNGKTLAISNTIYTVVIDIRSMFDDSITQADRDKTMQVLSDTLGIDMETMEGYYATDSEGNPINDTQYKVIAKDVSYDDGQTILNSGVKGVYLEAGSDRVYPQNTCASPIIGFLRGDDSSTYWGLEATYDDYLKGQTGRSFMSYTNEGDVSTNEVLAQNGDTVVTTLDLEMQSYAEELCKKYGELYAAEHTGILVMDPNTGEILTMAQYPTYNVNEPGDVTLFNSDTFMDTYNAATEEEQAELIYEVWKNFNISYTFEPGSIYKPMVVAAALDEGVISEDDTFVCDGGIQVADTYIPCWNTSGHGELTVSGVLANSCNVGMIQIGEKLGRELYYKYQHDFGYGEPTGIDLPGEATAENVMYTLDGLNSVEIATGSMGQGFNSTPLQSITAFASVINGGYLLQPYIVSRIVNSDNEVVYSNDTTVRRQVISTETSDFLRNALKETIESGTGKKVAVDGYNIGGKSGTAQQGVRSEDVHVYSFESYFPVENPQYVVLSTVYKPENDDSATATYMTHDMIEYIIQIEGLEPSDVSAVEEASTRLTNKLLLPELEGRTVEEATEMLNDAGYNYEIIGDGSLVNRTMPVGGSYVSKGSFVYLYVESQEGDSLELVPNVTGLTGEEAEKILTEAGFNVVLTKKTESGATVDTTTTTEDLSAMVVTKQMPSDSISIPTGSYIRLEVSE